MGTEIYNDDDIITVNRFWGGEHRGRCYQITGNEGCVQLTDEQFKIMLKTLRRLTK